MIANAANYSFWYRVIAKLSPALIFFFLPNRNLIENAKSTASFAANGIEQAGTYFGFRLSGPRKSLASVFEENIDMFETEIAEVAILYPWLFQRPLWMRFMQKFGTLAYMVHKINTTNADTVKGDVPNSQPDTQKSVPADIRDKYRDL